MTILRWITKGEHETFWLDFYEVYHIAWKSGRLFASHRIRRDFWTLSRESLLIERAKNGTSRWSCKAEASWSCDQKSNVFNVINLFIYSRDQL